MRKLDVSNATTDERRNIVYENFTTALRRHVGRDVGVGWVESARRRFVGDVEEDGAGLGQRADGVDANAKQVPETNLRDDHTWIG